MKVVTFNANGIRSAAKKGFYQWLQKENPDFVCIQETKVQRDQLDPHLFFPEYYHCEYSDAQKKGYSGVALYAKQKPHQIIKQVDYGCCDEEGRYLQFDYPNLSVISVYLPSGTTGPLRQEVKYHFLTFFAEHLKVLRRKGRELIICGDYNIAHKAIDLKNWRANQTHSGFLPEERAWMDELFGSLNFLDAFRIINQNTDEYTWWSNRGRAWEKNVGWRIDYQVITPGLASLVESAHIYKAERFSDHAPLSIHYNYNLTL